MGKVFHWSPLDLREKLKFNFGTYGILILNRPILLPPEAVTKIWNSASFRSTADGGTDRWFSYLKKNKIEQTSMLPDAVSGDFDSISPEILNLCEENGIYIEKTPDMNNTDFTKALKVMSVQCKPKLDAVVTIVDHSGRLDQTFSNLNTLFKINEIFQNEDLKGYLLTMDSITWLLRPGEHRIVIPEYLRSNFEWCSILPASPKKTSVTSTGLKWNLSNSEIEFGGLISSSNTYSGEPEVTITTDSEIIWCMSLGAEGSNSSMSLKSLSAS